MERTTTKYILHIQRMIASSPTITIELEEAPTLLAEGSRLNIGSDTFVVKKVDQVLKYNQSHPTPLVQEIFYTVDKS